MISTLPFEDGLGESGDSVDDLFDILSFVDIFGSDLDLGFAERFVEFTNVDTQQVCRSFSV